MRDYALLIFDWDGTLADSVGRIVEAMQLAAHGLGLPVCTDAQIRNIIGLALPEAIRTLYPELPEAILPQLRRDYSEHYLRLEAQPSALFPGVAEAMLEFRQAGYQLAVATGKGRRGLDRVLADQGWSDFFDVTRAADESAGKPDPRMLHEILQHCRVAPQDALMIGDSSFDLQMAQRAAMDSVAVGYGAQSLQALRDYAPTLEIEHFDELRRWLAAGRAAFS